MEGGDDDDDDDDKLNVSLKGCLAIARMALCGFTIRRDSIRPWFGCIGNCDGGVKSNDHGKFYSAFVMAIRVKFSFSIWKSMKSQSFR